MKTLTSTALAALLLLAALAPAGAVEVERTIELEDHGDNTSAEWTSEEFAGLAPQFAVDEEPLVYDCADRTQCEYSLIAIEGLTQTEIDDWVAAGNDAADLRDTVDFTVGITNYSVPVSDLDIIVWQSNEDGDKVFELGRVGELDEDPSEEYSGSILTRGTKPVAHILLEVVFFAGAGTYDGYVEAG